LRGAFRHLAERLTKTGRARGRGSLQAFHTSVDEGADRHYARLRLELERKGTPIGANDMLITAHALALDAVLVTDNVREFSRVKGLRMENWLSV